ncbi:MFS family permease [Streptomyces eurocidicus]|uniref:MFS family permease n=1 Tax=Streptomyces eurocidicus TaxID=66423 RepID=A0A7W8BE72_STREU|nr:MFS family permease [Streptomyces eurocidicus]
MISQVLSGAGLAAGITVGALLAEEMLGSTGLAGVPGALFTAGGALGAAAVGRLCRRRGRRPGLALGYAVGALGSLGVVVAAVAGSVPLLFLSLLVYGAGTSTGLLARYAGADLASPERRGRAVSTVLFATTLGAVVGPVLVSATGDVAHGWGMPRLAGPFLLAVAAFTAAAAPDPGAREEAGAATPPGRTDTRGLATGTAVMVLTQLVMIAIMTMTPVHMRAHGHGTQAAGGAVLALAIVPVPALSTRES